MARPEYEEVVYEATSGKLYSKDEDVRSGRRALNLDESVTKAIILDVSRNESTNLTTGDGKLKFRMPFAMTLTEVRASVTTAPVGSTIIIDIMEGAGSIFSTKLSIDASEKTSTTAATPAVISDASLADDAEISIDIDQIGSGTAGAGLKVYLIGTVTAT